MTELDHQRAAVERCQRRADAHRGKRDYGLYLGLLQAAVLSLINMENRERRRHSRT